MQELLTLSQAASRLGIHIATMRAWFRDGRVPAYRLGQRFTRVSWPAVLASLDPDRGTDPESRDVEPPSSKTETSDAD